MKTFQLLKKVNLGLDLQGGSYLLLEIDTKPLLKERLQEKIIPLKKFLTDNNIEYSNFNIKEEIISFDIKDDKLSKFEALFNKKEKIISTLYKDIILMN